MRHIAFFNSIDCCFGVLRLRCVDRRSAALSFKNILIGERIASELLCGDFMLTFLFWFFRIFQETIETVLSMLNRRYYEDELRQAEAMKVLDISKEDISKALAYSQDKQRFSLISSWLSLSVFFIFCVFGGFGFIDQWSLDISNEWAPGKISHALVFFGSVSVLSAFLSVPLSFYSTFVIEQKHGFNRQTIFGFFSDLGKGALLGCLLGGILIAGIVWVMDRLGDMWWVWAWALVSGFSIFLAWIFPTFLAPLFNKFQPLPPGELNDSIYELSRKINFPAGDISVMDASKRSSHGNAYFTGLFGQKKIVLFDTLVSAMSSKQVVAVLAHELGHFKLHHVRWGLVRGVLMMGLSLFLLAKAITFLEFYEALGFSNITFHGALVVFSLWFGLIQFLFHPISTWLSRRNEFAADRFAKTHASAEDLVSALLKLRETSHSMPLTHPLYSAFYLSHPPLLERIRALRESS